jgi:hypothetical protein
MPGPVRASEVLPEPCTSATRLPRPKVKDLQPAIARHLNVPGFRSRRKMAAARAADDPSAICTAKVE